MDGYKNLPEVFYFQDDGFVPNSKFPSIVYRSAFPQRGQDGAEWLEKKFAENAWTNAWRNGIYYYHHFHSTAHEVLGVYEGSAMVQMGGENGRKLRINAGDVIVIPAGVAHMQIEGENLQIVGAYADGRQWDLMKGAPGERPEADINIAAVPFPARDPLLGADGGLMKIWKR